MSVYHRYASGEYDKTYFEKASESRKHDDKVGRIQISPLLGQFSTSDMLYKFNEKSIEEWLAIFPKAAYFKGYDETFVWKCYNYGLRKLAYGKVKHYVL